MNEILMLTLSLLSGILLGFLFFGGLWLTLSHLPGSREPSLFVLTSFLARSALCLLGFYLIGKGGLEMLAFSLAGFVLSKLALICSIGLQARRGV
jgi:F1F0 ATPase subunit 2